MRLDSRDPRSLAGIGFKPGYFEALMQEPVRPGFLEVHAENFMVAGGPALEMLDALAARWPLSIHGVGLSIGGVQRPDKTHLKRLRRLLERYHPALFSEHLAWSGHDGIFFNDLLPITYDMLSLLRVCAHVDEIQAFLGRRLLLENPSSYVEFSHSTWSEADFLREITRRTGCGLLLDINNLYVSGTNHGRDPQGMLREMPLDTVGQIHLAGFAVERDADGGRLLIDTHGAAVADDVWALYRLAINMIGAKPTLIERDENLPTLPVLVAESGLAAGVMQAAAETRLGREPARREALQT